MDRFTRNYSIILGIVVLGLVALFMYESPEITELNDILLGDNRLSAYPYRFRVLQLENNVATMTTPRSAEFPAYRALGLMYPNLDGLPQDDPRLMQGQLDMAQIQEYAKTRVIESGLAGHVAWALDTDWLANHDIYIDEGY